LDFEAAGVQVGVLRQIGIQIETDAFAALRAAARGAQPAWIDADVHHGGRLAPAPTQHYAR
jgi:hypothetical protein